MTHSKCLNGKQFNMNVCSDFPLDDSDEKQIDGDNDYATIVGFLHDSLLLVEMNDFDEEYESVI